MESWNDFQRPPKRWSPGALFFLACGLFVVLLVVTLTVAGITFAGRGSARPAREKAQIREAGEPGRAAAEILGGGEQHIEAEGEIGGIACGPTKPGGLVH